MRRGVGPFTSFLRENTGPLQPPQVLLGLGLATLVAPDYFPTYPTYPKQEGCVVVAPRVAFGIAWLKATAGERTARATRMNFIVEGEEVASCRKWTQFGVYMPVRQRTATVVRPTWEKLTEALDATRGEYMIGGDFNAETEEALRERGAQRAKTAQKAPKSEEKAGGS